MMRRLLVSLAILMAAGVLTAPAQKATFSVAAEEVRIDVLVTDRGKPVTGLTAADFEVFDNGIRQEIQYARLQKQAPINATLVFDMSRSVSGKLLDHLKSAARAFLDDLTGKDYAAFITFNNAVVLGSPPTHDIAKIKQVIDGVQPFGNSSLIDGSYAGLVLAESKPDPPLLVIFSDGRDTFSWLTAAAVLETAKENDAVVYAVSPDRLSDKSFLGELTRLTGGSLFQVESTGELAAVFLRILEEFRQHYLVTYTPQGVQGEGWHKLDVRVQHRSAKVRARPGYMRSTAGD